MRIFGTLLYPRLAAWVGRLFRQKTGASAECGSLEAAYWLNEAIRADDIAAVKAALEAGASLRACTLDYEGYHSPHELAARHGRADIERLLNEVAGRGLPRK